MADFCCYPMDNMPTDCGSNIGGIARAWIACHKDVTKPTVNDEMVSTIKSPESWHLIEFQEQTGSLTFTSSDNTDTNAKLWTNTVVFQFARLETAKRLNVMAMALGVNDIIVEENNGRYWYLGYDFGCKLSEGTAETGTSYEDFNGYNITMTDVQKQHPYEITEAAMAPLLGEEE